MRLNKEAYEVKPDNLIYDNTHPIDGYVVSIKVPAEKAGVLKRGQILDFSESDGSYVPHAEGGSVSAIVVNDVDYAADDTEVSASVYISGTFRKSVCITDVALTAADIEKLRSRGIYLK